MLIWSVFEHCLQALDKKDGYERVFNLESGMVTKESGKLYHEMKRHHYDHLDKGKGEPFMIPVLVLTGGGKFTMVVALPFTGEDDGLLAFIPDKQHFAKYYLFVLMINKLEVFVPDLVNICYFSMPHTDLGLVDNPMFRSGSKFPSLRSCSKSITLQTVRRNLERAPCGMRELLDTGILRQEKRRMLAEKLLVAFQ